MNRIVEHATRDDWTQIAALLRNVELPLHGLSAYLGSTLVAPLDNEMVGCAALELYGDSALLRSVAVNKSQQDQDLGHDLTMAILDLARELGVRNVFLLTETAAAFFARFGFRLTGRSDVPEVVRQSVEFTSVCPSSAPVMVLRLDECAGSASKAIC